MAQTRQRGAFISNVMRWLYVVAAASLVVAAVVQGNAAMGVVAATFAVFAVAAHIRYRLIMRTPPAG